MAPNTRSSDTFQILVATDNHVGYNERDPNRGDDSAKAFHEVMCLAKERDVDFVLLAGDLFHDNKPSRKSMNEVIRSLRMISLGDKPCEFEVIGDQSEIFTGVFDHVNYYDQNINVGIPVFSIHGNHDDPSGEGHLAALDVLSTAGYVNYYGRVPEADKIEVKPVLLQKGRTKLALYGLSNVRDERLYRTFRDGKVKFFRPAQSKDEWFNLLSVHQNHHQRGTNDTNYLPVNFLPSYMDLVIWGHEHECKIDPEQVPQMGFYVMQPGSSVATSLIAGEAVQKSVSLLSITGKEFKSEAIPLKTVRPFVYREIKLVEEPGMDKIMKKNDNKDDVRRHLRSVVEEMIEEANNQWLKTQNTTDPGVPPLPLIRLKVDYSAPEGAHFDVENPQRFSNFFLNKVANVSDVVAFNRKTTRLRKIGEGEVEQPEASVLDQITLDSVRVEKLVKEYLSAQSLTILPQNSFGSAVNQFVNKDDRTALEQFVQSSLSKQVKHLMKFDDERDIDDQVLLHMIDNYRTEQERGFDAGKRDNTVTSRKLKPKPSTWDSDFDGHWVDQPGAFEYSEHEVEEQEEEQPSANRSRGRGGKSMRGGAKPTRGNAKSGRATKKRKVDSDDEDEDDDVVMLDDEEEEDDDDNNDEPEEVTPPPKTRASTRTQPAPKNASKAASKPAAKPKTTAKSSNRQSQLSFNRVPSAQKPATNRSNTSSAPAAKGRNQLSDDEISDDDAFESAPATRSRR